MSLYSQWTDIKEKIARANLIANRILDKIPYTELEYIQSNGNQYFNTGIIANNHYIELKAQYTSAVNNSILLGYNSNDFHITWYSNKWYYGNNGSESNGGGSYVCTNLNTFVYGKNTPFTINGNVVNSSCNAYTNYNLWLLRRPGNERTPASAKIYYFKIYNKSTNLLVRYFVPVKDENNIACMYDKVTKSLFYSTGSQQFIAGPIV